MTEENVAPLLMPFSDREVFSITPVVAGAGRGVGSILAGAALIATAIVFAPAAGGFLGMVVQVRLQALQGSRLERVASSAIGSIGLSLVLGGVAQAISPQPNSRV